MYYFAFVLLALSMLCALAGAAWAVKSLWPRTAPAAGKASRRTSVPGLGFVEKANLCLTGCYIIASAILIYALASYDFSLVYVASYTDRLLPLFYRITAFWAGQAGSMLFWAFSVAICGGLFQLTRSYKSLTPDTRLWYWVFYLGIMSFFGLILVTWNNPFLMNHAVPQDGNGLNPLLQNPGMIFHPPLLFLGYGGFVIPSCLALAQALSRRQADEAAWTDVARPFTLAAWAMLTAGIVLGGWWAYMELGWGGYWAWDPVENASFMPWLVGTALLHSLAVTEKRGSFRAWTVLLAIAAFSLCLLGTFLVRSGVLVSVHAFASDPSRGLFILVLLIVAIGGSLLLYALKGGRVRARVEHTLWSRESFLLGNNILLMAAMLVVLLGTLLPLVHKELGLGSISIGEPFFNTMFTALMAPFALLLGLGPLIRWRRDDVARQIKRLIIALLVTLSLSLALPWLLQDRITAMAVIGLMVLGHVGVAVTVIGITFSQNYSVERDVRMRPGDSIDIHRYHFVFNGVRNIVGPNWTGGEGIIAVTRNGRPEATLYAEKRFYTASRMMMTEAAISGGLTRDLYAALGEELSDGSWAVRLYYKPFVRWIWYGGVLMALGGLCCMLDPRYRMRKKLQEAS